MNMQKHTFPLIILLAILVYSCASTGRPDGGPYDEDPPKFMGSSPRPFALNVKQNKLELHFDEFIKLEKASEKVIVSPPQLEQPEIKVVGKKVVVHLIDTLKEGTTYTVDFSDAIVDNNEGNPMGNFTYTFSTGSSIDTMEVSGTVLNAENLEPIKGIQVGLHSDLSDSAFIKKPFERVSRTDSRGRFNIRGIAPGKYRIYALKDGNQNYLFDSKSEVIAFSDSLVIPSCMPATRQDTVWRDTLTYDTIKTVGYTRFMPDDLVLRAFKEETTRQYLKTKTRDKENHFVLVFGAKADTLPTLKGLNFDEKDAFVIESTPRNDSICYWVKDSLIYQQDTLMIQMNYLSTDTLDQLVPTCDTLYLANKLTREQREKIAEKERKEKEKERKKKEKKGEKIEPEPIPFLKMKVEAPGELDLDKNIEISFEEPLAQIDTAGIRLSIKKDSVFVEEPCLLMADSVLPRKYLILADWQPGQEYQFEIDSAAIRGLYGLASAPIKQEFKVKELDQYGALLFNIRGADSTAIVQLLDASEKVLRSVRITRENTADFYYLTPETKYYVRLFLDRNGNGIWDTGNYETHQEPEEVYYFSKVWQMKANFDFEENWDIHAVPVERQKLNELKKQKPEEEKKVQNKNKERAKRLGR